MKILIDKETAQSDVERFLEARFVTDEAKTANSAVVKKLVESVQYGQISIDASGAITQKLNSPIKGTDGSTVLAKLDYKLRLTMNEVDMIIQGGEKNANMVYAVPLTGQDSILLGKLDTSDVMVLANIVVFFTT